jgi:hypothetical protein
VTADQPLTGDELAAKPRGRPMNDTEQPTTVLVYRPGFGWVSRPVAS